MNLLFTSSLLVRLTVSTSKRYGLGLPNKRKEQKGRHDAHRHVDENNGNPDLDITKDYHEREANNDDSSSSAPPKDEGSDVGVLFAAKPPSHDTDSFLSKDEGTFYQLASTASSLEGRVDSDVDIASDQDHGNGTPRRTQDVTIDDFLVECTDGYVDCVGGFVVGSSSGVTCQAACEGNCCVGSNDSGTYNSCTSFTGKVCKDGSCSISNPNTLACTFATIGYVVNSCKGANACLGAGAQGGIKSITGSCNAQQACFSTNVESITGSCNAMQACASRNEAIDSDLNACCNTERACAAGLSATLPAECFPTTPPSKSPTTPSPPVSSIPASDIPASGIPASDIPASDIPASDIPASGIPGSALATPPAPMNCGGTAKWHPNYNLGWSRGECRCTVDANSPGYPSELACCRGAYAGQTSGHCLSQLPSPPTTSPIGIGGLDLWYPDYSINDWSNGFCRNDSPLPNGWPTYSSNLACCKGSYGGQMSGKCLSLLPSPPTTSPTNSAFEVDFYYPVYEVEWSSSGCSNSLPLPFNNRGDRPEYATLLACCKGAYAGQMSGTCLAALPNPPTTAPSDSSGGSWTANRDMDYQFATCQQIGRIAIPGSRTEYDTLLECCKGAYAMQASGACLSGLPSPPTQNPTTSTGVGASGWFADRGSQTCSNGVYTGFETTFASEAACCQGVFGSFGNGAQNSCNCPSNSCFSCGCPGASVTGACPTLGCE